MLKSTNFPSELVDIATSIEQESNRQTDVDNLLENLTKQLAEFYQILEGENGAERIRREWANRSSYHQGKTIQVKLANETFVGVTCGIEENGALRVSTENGEIKIIHAGEVERLRKV